MIMRCSAILALLLLAPTAALAHDGNEHFGVAGSTGTQMCAALQAADAQEGERVAVIDPNPPQRVRWATLEHPETDACAAWQRGADLSGRVFVLRLAPVAGDGDGDGDGFIGIVVRGASGISVRHAKVVARIDRGTALRFRSCTSSEGLHLSAWPSPKISGRPFWHSYVYLGYDVEPTCSEAETRDAASAPDPAARAGTAR
jgi:hypothetical protein